MHIDIFLTKLYLIFISFPHIPFMIKKKARKLWTKKIEMSFTEAGNFIDNILGI